MAERITEYDAKPGRESQKVPTFHCFAKETEANPADVEVEDLGAHSVELFGTALRGDA